MEDIYFKRGFGIVTEHDPISENGGLFLAHYAMDKRNVKGMSAFLEKMQMAKQSSGLYLRSFHHTKRSVSHDEITGMMATSAVYNTLHRRIIWCQLKENFWAYPAKVISFSDRLPFNPSNYYAWGSYVGSSSSTYFLPFYLINMIISLGKPKGDVSSKLIYHLELNTMPKTKINSWLLSIFNKKMIEQYGTDFKMVMRKIYFQGEKPEFPLFQE